MEAVCVHGWVCLCDKGETERLRCPQSNSSVTPSLLYPCPSCTRCPPSLIFFLFFLYFYILSWYSVFAFTCVAPSPPSSIYCFFLLSHVHPCQPNILVSPRLLPPLTSVVGHMQVTHGQSVLTWFMFTPYQPKALLFSNFSTQLCVNVYVYVCVLAPGDEGFGWELYLWFMPWKNIS